jgi:hypothetical protein
MGHFSAANLVEACRSYNAIVAPPALDDAAPTSAPRRDRSGGRTDSSTNRSSDPGDVRR